MESACPPTIAKRLWHIVRVVYYMLRKGISKRKIMMDLHLLLHHGKLAGKALGNLLTFHHHHHGGTTSSTTTGSIYSSFSCRSMDPNLSFYNPLEVQFSCSNTPSYPSFNLNKRKNRRHHSHHYDVYDYEAAAAIARAFEILNSEISDAESVAPSPSPAPRWGFGKSPLKVRQLRITDSPFPVKEEEVADGRVDKEADEFIKRFYEQLRLQQRIAVTPEYKFRQG